MVSLSHRQRTHVFHYNKVIEWSNDGEDDDNGKEGSQKSKKPADTDFGFFEAVTPPTYSAAQLRKEIEDAMRINPDGVKVAGVRPETMGTVAGYLHFKTTGLVIKWLEDEDKLRGLLSDWLEEKRNAFGCPVKYKSDPGAKDFGVAKLFETMKALTPESTALVTGDIFPITHAMLKMDVKRDDPGYYCYLHAIHRIIKAYPDHFPNDTPLFPKEIHSRENWHRGLVTLRAFWGQHREGKIRQRGARSTSALKPLWLDDEALKSSGGKDTEVEYAVYKAREADEILELDILSSGDDEDDSFEERQTQNIAEIEALHRSLNGAGDIAKETVSRCKDSKKKTRKETPPEDMKAWIEILKEKHDKYRIVSEPVKGPSKSDPQGNPLIINAINVQDTLDSIGELSAPEREQFERDQLERGTKEQDEERKEFFNLLESMSSASAKPKSFVECCEKYGFDYSDPKNIKVRGVPFKPYPHQVIGKYINNYVLDS